MKFALVTAVYKNRRLYAKNREINLFAIVYFFLKKLSPYSLTIIYLTYNLFLYIKSIKLNDFLNLFFILFKLIIKKI